MRHRRVDDVRFYCWGRFTVAGGGTAPATSLRSRQRLQVKRWPGDGGRGPAATRSSSHWQRRVSGVFLGRDAPAYRAGTVLVLGIPSFARIRAMESKLATESRRSLLAANQRLTPSQRLDAYVVHCRLMFDLYQAGQRVRNSSGAAPDDQGRIALFTDRNAPAPAEGIGDFNGDGALDIAFRTRYGSGGFAFALLFGRRQ